MMPTVYEEFYAQLGEVQNGFCCVTIYGRSYSVPFIAFEDTSLLSENCYRPVCIATWFFRTVQLNQNA